MNQELQDNNYMDQLNNYIVILKNIVPQELCNTILKEYADSNEWVQTGIGKNGTPNLELRNCHTIEMSQPFIINESKLRRSIDAEIFNCAGNCIQEYNNQFPHAHIAEDTGYELLRYTEGQFYIQHVDSFLQAPRLISCSFALNDNYEGGEFAFFDRELKYKLNQGDVIMFPSTFMYPHEIMPVTKGTRYSIITWFR